MNDSDGGSGAARRALDQAEGPQRGIMGRILDALRSGENDEDDSEGTGAAVRSLIPGLAKLQRLRLEDVAIPKAEIAAAPVDTDLRGLVERFRESGYSRLPVYDETLDRPLGLVLLKDLALNYGFNGSGGSFELRPLLRPMIYAPPSMPLAVLLQKMQAERIHLALMIDEYGGVDGLVTIEDLIEQVVGEIEDEHDTEEEGYWQHEATGGYLALARAPLTDFEAEIGMSLLPEGMEDEIDTLGGLVFVLSGRVPGRGEVIPHPEGIEFEVVDADPRRIKRLRVRLPDFVARSTPGVLAAGA